MESLTSTPEHVILDEGDVWVMVDAVKNVYYVDALVDSSTVTLRHLFEDLELLGLTLMEDWEYDPVDLPSGHVRRHLAPAWF